MDEMKCVIMGTISQPISGDWCKTKLSQDINKTRDKCNRDTTVILYTNIHHLRPSQLI